jgi:hypothetical protein
MSLIGVTGPIGNVKTISECITPRGSYTSDNQEFSSYPYAFDRDCPYGVTDKEIIDADNIKVCQPHMPPFQNQYTVHSHFQDLFLKADCPSCVADVNSPCNKTSNLNNNPDCLQTDCLYVDPAATQFTSVPMPVCFDGNTSYMLAGANGPNLPRPVLNGSSLLMSQAPNNLTPYSNANVGSSDSMWSNLSYMLSWILGIFLVLSFLTYLNRGRR